MLDERLIHRWRGLDIRQNPASFNVMYSLRFARRIETSGGRLGLDIGATDWAHNRSRERAAGSGPTEDK
jgi:hypothetical protein